MPRLVVRLYPKVLYNLIQTMSLLKESAKRISRPTLAGPMLPSDCVLLALTVREKRSG